MAPGIHNKKGGKGETKKDFQGIYVFVHDRTPFYIGISKGVIGRIIQHTKGHSHHTSTLAYNIGLIRYEIEKGHKYIGGRKEFDFKADVAPAKEFLLKQNGIAMLAQQVRDAPPQLPLLKS